MKFKVKCSNLQYFYVNAEECIIDFCLNKRKTFGAVL